MVANILMSNRGYPRIYHGDHSYGLQIVRQDRTVWLCTGSIKKRRCTASVETKEINGVLMMKEKNQKHFCEGQQ